MGADARRQVSASIADDQIISRDNDVVLRRMGAAQVGVPGRPLRDIVLSAANLGDNADTTAAVCGQLAGVIYGVGGIDVRWLERLAIRPEIERLAVRLHELSGIAGA
jgi:hypothetical protein